jgi:hypothetical protein
MDEITANVNWLAVIVGAVLAFLLGWLWYSPKLFGTKWAEGIGVQLGGATAPPAAAMVAQAIGTFLLAWVVGVTAASNALFTFILVVLTIAVLIAAGGLFAGKSRYAIATESGFVIAMGVVMFAVQAVL